MFFIFSTPVRHLWQLKAVFFPGMVSNMHCSIESQILRNMFELSVSQPMTSSYAAAAHQPLTLPSQSWCQSYNFFFFITDTLFPGNTI